MNLKSLIILILSAGFVANVAVAAPKDQPEPSTSGFVNFTTATFNGGQGIATYTNACNSEHAGTHMCNSEEFLNSAGFPATSGSAWIKPTFVPADARVLDMSGIQAPSGNLTCYGWSSGNSAYAGLVVDFDGRFGTSPCNVSNSVACCR